jgi:hypothetical protein
MSPSSTERAKSPPPLRGGGHERGAGKEDVHHHERAAATPVDSFGERVDDDFTPGLALHGPLWYYRALAASPRFRGTSDGVGAISGRNEGLRRGCR